MPSHKDIEKVYTPEDLESMYSQRSAALTADWASRRKKIILPTGLAGRGAKYPKLKDFAAMVGLSVTAYGNLERGTARPKRETFKRVMDVFARFNV